MDWVKPQYSRNQVDHAGKIVTGVGVDFDIDAYLEAYNIVQNWRTAHSFPLNTFQNALRARAQSIGGSLIVSQRLKRYPSIVRKLIRAQTSSMQLSRMQDIGGCRAVLDTVTKAKSLSKLYLDSMGTRFPHDLVREGKNYIDHPKSDGYRGIHLVYRFIGRKTNPAWNNLRIEIQIRSVYQHAWAMAVETVDIFTGQALKSNEGDESWKRFFLLMSAFIAHLEDSPLCMSVPEHINEILSEIVDIEKRLNIIDRLASYQTVVNITNSGPHREAGYHLVYLDFGRKQVTIESFSWNESEKANEKYSELEKQYVGAPIVLVKSRSVGALRKAYPSFFLDSGAFIDLVRNAITMREYK